MYFKRDKERIKISSYGKISYNKNISQSVTGMKWLMIYYIFLILSLVICVLYTIYHRKCSSKIDILRSFISFNLSGLNLFILITA